MAGVSDPVFRSLCIELGADLTYTEMVSAKGLSYANEKTQNLIARAPGEDLIAVQLFGHEPATMAHEAVRIEDLLGSHLAYIDINMGCPARKIVRKGDGGALMDDPVLAAKIATQVSSAVEHPVTVKFRRGYHLGSETAAAFAKRLEAAGVAAVAVHGRFVGQYYRGQSENTAIARVVEAVSIPVIGNGDVKGGTDAKAMFDETGCDAVMVGRAAQGNPWVFADVRSALGGPSFSPPTIDARIGLAKRHARLLSEGEGGNIVRMRKHAMWYLSGVPEAARARREINACVSYEDFEEVLDRALANAHAARLGTAG